MRGKAEKREDEAFSIWPCSCVCFSLQREMRCMLHVCSYIHVWTPGEENWRMKAGVPANSLPHSLLCPVIQPQTIIHHHTWSQRPHTTIYCCVAIWFVSCQCVKRASEGSRLPPHTAFSWIMDLWYSITKCCVSVFVRIYCLRARLDHSKFASVWACCYRLQVKDQIQTSGFFQEEGLIWNTEWCKKNKVIQVNQ